VSGYGPVLGYQAPRLSEATPLNETLVWRGRRMDPSGLYCLGARYYDPVAGRFLSPDPGGHGASMDLYSFADGDPINQFDPDGRFVAGAWNGAKSWGSDTYATAGNLVDALFRHFSTEHFALEHFPGGHEADPNYSKNFENGSTAYQLGHMAGYVGAELGFQFGLTAMAKGMGMLARMATLRSAGMAAEFGLETAEVGARGFELVGAESMAARGEAGAVRAEAAFMRAEAGMAARTSGARAESATTRLFDRSGLTAQGRWPGPPMMAGDTGSRASLDAGRRWLCPRPGWRRVWRAAV
jgi:RHS repeat-associated protein